MSWTQHSETPFANAQKAAINPSGWADQYRDGQKLRQEYDARQHQKALGEIMKIDDHNGRLDAARQNKYAGALIPMLQKYDEDRQKAALDNLKAGADIGKIYGETGKLGAETGKIGAETGEISAKTQNTTLEGLIKKYGQISAAALTQNPQYFALMLGDFENQGLINPDQKGMILNMIMKDPQNAAAVMQGIAKGSIEGFKATTPTVQSTNLGDRYGMTSYDPQTGQVTGLGDFAIGQSANNAADNAGRYQVAGMNNQSREAVADLQSRTSMYNTDAGNQSREGIAGEKLAVDWFKAQTGASISQQNADTNRINANKTGATAGFDANGRPVARKLESNERTKLFELQEQIDADIGVGTSLKRLNELSDQSYSGAGASFRGTFMSRIPGGGNNERANATVLSENITIELALKQLKSTFGAAPTEGERKILMDLQASVDKSPVQKKQIIAAAMRAVAERIRYRKKQQEAIRTGSYTMPKGTGSASTTTTAKPKAASKGNAIIDGILGGK